MFPFRPPAITKRRFAFITRNFDVHRVVLPRVLSIHRGKQTGPRHAGAAGSITRLAACAYGWKGRCYLCYFLPDGVAQYRRRACSPPALSVGSKRRRGWNRAADDVLGLTVTGWRKRGLQRCVKAAI